MRHSTATGQIREGRTAKRSPTAPFATQTRSPAATGSGYSYDPFCYVRKTRLGRVGQALAPAARSLGQLLQKRLRAVPGHAGVGDALAVDQLAPALVVLA